MNYVTDNRFVIVAADLAESINVEPGGLWGHYDPVHNPTGTRLKRQFRRRAMFRPPSGSSGSRYPLTRTNMWASGHSAAAMALSRR